MKKLIVGFIMLLGVLFLLSIIVQSKFLLKDDEKRFTNYWEEKQVHIEGKIIDYHKGSARNKSIVVEPSVFQVVGESENLAMGFTNRDTSICIVIAPLPKIEVDSLVILGSEVEFYHKNKKVNSNEVQLLRWNTIQRTQIKLEEKYGELEVF